MERFCAGEAPAFGRRRISQWVPRTERIVLKSRVPLGRYASPDEVAKLALWLASDDSAYASGAEFILDGGQTA